MSTISLRLPDSLHKAVRDLAKQENVSINQFIVLYCSFTVQYLFSFIFIYLFA